MLNSIEWLQAWYQAQCNGEWEQSSGISMESLDNPGWCVRVDLHGTALENVPMVDVSVGQINHDGLDGEQNWLHCQVDDSRFVGAGGPVSLLAICDAFRQWAESVPPAE